MELIVFDLDGTLLNRQQRLSDYTRSTLEKLKAAGIQYTVATGRTHLAAAPCIQNHNFENWIIFKNGVEWWHPKENQYRHQYLLTPDHINPTLASFSEHKITPFVFCLDKDGSYRVYHAPLTSHLSQHITNELGHHDSLSLHPLEELSDDAMITNISAMGHPEGIECIVMGSNQHPDLIAYSGGGVYTPDAHWLDIHHSSASKGSALEALKQEIGAEKIIVFGDGDNDLSMFEFADECYAMENASESVKEASDEVIGHHDEDGVARFLRRRYDL